jgi:hypothetical protein
LQLGYSISQKQIRVFVRQQFNKVPSRRWFWHLVHRHSDRLADAKTHPQEDTRLNITKAIARKHVTKWDQHMQNVPTELIFNLDEVSCQEWQRGNRAVIISHQFRLIRVDYSVPRADKWINCMIPCSMTGDT